MNEPLKVLMIEDSPSDAALVERELSSAGRTIERTWVTDASELAVALRECSYDIVLSDYALPGFDVLSALEMVRAADADVPFVVVSGTIGEERAVELMRSGVADYVLKDNLTRLGDIVDRAIRETGERKARRGAEDRLMTAGREWHKTFDAISDAVLLLDNGGRIRRMNRAALRYFDVTAEQALGADILAQLVVVAGGHQRERLEHFRQQDIGRFELGPCGDESTWFDVSIDEILDEDDDARTGWVAVLTDITGRKRSESELRSLVSQLEQTMRGAVSIAAHMVEKRDPYTAGHQDGVAEVAVRIAKGLDMSAEKIELVRTASLLHDIGKIAVPAEILVKPGRLDEYEWLIIQRHPQVGAEILEDAEFAAPIAEIIRQHHERLDGSGYPSGLTGPDICLEARIIAVADVTEAMLAHRPYRAARTLEETQSELRRGRGTIYDERVVDAALASLAAQPQTQS
jgi:putative nucleotidyltransferase with HDIG domain/PAS domain S-box-containing protein